MPELLWGVSRGKPRTTRHPHPLLLSRCDGSGGGEMPGFEVYNHHPTTPPNLYVRSSQKADLAVDLGLVLVGGAVGCLQEFVEGHGPAETPGFEGSVR